MTQAALKNVITIGIEGLPLQSLQEIADHVLLAHVKTLGKSTMLQALVAEELEKLRKAEAQQVEKEFQHGEEAVADAPQPKPRPRFGSAKGMFVMKQDFDEPLENGKLGFGYLKGKIHLAPDWDEPLEDFKEYMY